MSTRGRAGEEKKERAHAALVAKHGEQGAANIEAAAEAKKEKKAAAAACAAALAEARSALQRAMVRAATDEAGAEGARLPKRKLKLRLNKAEAKATFGYNETEMAALPCTKNGRANIYQTAELVAAYARGHRRNRGAAVTSAAVLEAVEAHKVTAAAAASAAALAALLSTHGGGSGDGSDSVVVRPQHQIDHIVKDRGR